MAGPAGNSIFIPTGAAPNYTQFMEDDPFYKQDITWINDALALNQSRLAEDRAFNERAYALNVAQLNNSANSGGDYGLAAAQAAAALAKEKAAHDNVNRAEYLREWLAGRGMVSSGQNAWEQNERQYQFDMYNRGIDQDLAARESSIAQQRAEAQSRLALQLQELQLNKERSDLGYTRDLQDMASGAARSRGQAAFDLYSRLKADGRLNAPGVMAMWDPESGLYVTADGKYYDQWGNATTWARQQAASAANPGQPSWAPTVFPESRPTTNPLPGAWGYE